MISMNEKTYEKIASPLLGIALMFLCTILAIVLVVGGVHFIGMLLHWYLIRYARFLFIIL